MSGQNPGETPGPTGDAAVDALVALAAQAGELPVSGHQERYLQVLDGLESELNADPETLMHGSGIHGAAP